MPKPSRNAGAKAKDFKSAIKRLFKELKGFRKLIVISLILAALGSILTIFTPNILSDLTDKISEGLVVNQDNLQELITTVTSNLDQDKISKLMNFDLSEKNITSIMMNKNVSDEDKKLFNEVLGKLANSSKDESFALVKELPESILKLIIVPSKGIEVNELVGIIKGNGKIPNTLATIMFKEIEIDGTKISVSDQVEFLNIMGTMSKDSTPEELYEKIDQMPESIQKVVEPFMDMEGIKSIVIFLVAIYLLSAVFMYIESISMTIVSNNFARKLRSTVSTKINKLPLKYFDSHAIGDTLSIVTNDVDTIAQSMNQSLSTLVSAITLFVGTTIMMFVTNWILALTAIGASLFGFIFMFGVLGKSQKYFVARQKQLGDLNGHIEETYSGLNVVKTYNGKRISDEEFDNLNNKLYESSWKSHFLGGLMHPMMNFVGNFGYVAVCIVGALLTLNGYVSFGVIIAFITYVRLFTSPLSQIAQSMSSMQSVAAASERVFEFFDEQEMADESHVQKVLNKEEVKGEIEFKNVIFQYDGNDKPTIKNFSAKAKTGQKIAIVGPTGAGKTTMVNLLMKFYELSGGDIKIDGISTKELSRDNIHKLFTMVLQDTWLFSGTVKDNIVYNRENVSDYDVREVCKTVGLDHFIKTLPNGYDTDISDNDSVSAGQRQLLTIARGMIEDSPFLILDEATSNVDTRTEELVQKAMDKLTEGKTSFIIAHRLSTIKNADIILVMRDGNIVEQGNHDELMKQNGFYAELYNSQFEL